MKRAVGLLLSLVMVFSIAGAAGDGSRNAHDYDALDYNAIYYNAHDYDALDYNAPQPRPVLYSSSRFSGNASADSTEFTATKGSGTTIRVWYENQENSSVTVRLYKYGWFGLKSVVLEFDVSGNSNRFEEYTANGADTGKYYINVEASDGGVITGYLRANQIS